MTFASAVRAQFAEGLHAEPPELALELYARGQAAYNAGRIREASRWFEQALLLDPQSPALTYQVALVHEQLGDIPKAVRYYERYLNFLTPHEPEERLRIHRTLRRLRSSLQPDGQQLDGHDAEQLLLSLGGQLPASQPAPSSKLEHATVLSSMALRVARALTRVRTARNHGRALTTATAMHLAVTGCAHA